MSTPRNNIKPVGLEAALQYLVGRPPEELGNIRGISPADQRRAAQEEALQKAKKPAQKEVPIGLLHPLLG